MRDKKEMRVVWVCHVCCPFYPCPQGCVPAMIENLSSRGKRRDMCAFETHARTGGMKVKLTGFLENERSDKRELAIPERGNLSITLQQSEVKVW